MKTAHLIAIIGFALVFSSCKKEEETSPQTTPENKEITGTIWKGAKFTFKKTDGADPTLETNQDRLTDNVWITRGNTGGQIYNAKDESTANKDLSPQGTEWALGTTANVSTLTFGRFRGALGQPKNLIGKDLVMHIIKDDIYVDVKILSWDGGKKGGFSYERSTK